MARHAVVYHQSPVVLDVFVSYKGNNITVFPRDADQYVIHLPIRINKIRFPLTLIIVRAHSRAAEKRMRELSSREIGQDCVDTRQCGEAQEGI